MIVQLGYQPSVQHDPDYEGEMRYDKIIRRGWHRLLYCPIHLPQVTMRVISWLSWPWYLCESVHWHDFLHQLVNLSVSPGFPSPPRHSRAKQRKRRASPENNTRPSLFHSTGHQTCLCSPIYCLFAPLMLEWWHLPLYLQWIKTETDVSSSSGDPSPEWMGFRWPLMHPEVKLCRSSVLCFHVVSNPHRMGTKSPVSFGGSWWIIPPQSAVWWCPGKE